MDAQFKNTAASNESIESIQIANDSGNGKYQLFSPRKLLITERIKYRILVVLVVLALILSIISLALPRVSKTIEETEQRSPQKQVEEKVMGSMFCGEDEDFQVLMNAYTTEGITATPNSQQLTSTSGYRECYRQCIETYPLNCSFFSFQDKDGMCTISSADFYSTWTLTEAVDGAISCYRTRTDGWKMLYRRPKLTKSGYVNEVTGPWVDNAYYSNGTLYDNAAALPDGVTWSIMKSQLTRYWENLNIEKVKVSLYKDGKEVHHLIFNGRGSNTENWFHSAFLLETTWKDLSPANPAMYIGWWYKDSQTTLTSRAMYVASAHLGCPEDRLWMSLTQNQVDEGCGWGQVGDQNVPRLFFAPGNTEAHVSALGEADFVVISVSFPLTLS